MAISVAISMAGSETSAKAPEGPQAFTIAGQATAEIVEKKSRFIAQLSHVETEEEALAFLQQIREKHRMARHNVYAYRLRDGRARYSDDGEPAQTAGRPTLAVLENEGYVDVVAVTTRYFGGVLLGKGGLVRAYTDAVAQALQAAPKAVILSCSDVQAQLPYALYDQAKRLLQQKGAEEMDAQFSDIVTLKARIKAEDAEGLAQALDQMTHGKGRIVVSQPTDVCFPV